MYCFYYLKISHSYSYYLRKVNVQGIQGKLWYNVFILNNITHSYKKIISQLFYQIFIQNVRKNYPVEQLETRLLWACFPANFIKCLHCDPNLLVPELITNLNSVFIWMHEYIFSYHYIVFATILYNTVVCHNSL